MWSNAVPRGAGGRGVKTTIGWRDLERKHGRLAELVHWLA